PWRRYGAFSPPVPAPSRCSKSWPSCSASRWIRASARSRSTRDPPALIKRCCLRRKVPMQRQAKKQRQPLSMKARTPPSRREQILADFATLRIPVTAEQLDAALVHAQDTGLTHLDFLHRLLTDQAGLRRQRS